jgi:DNA-binding transcriptional LysR family regulator
MIAQASRAGIGLAYVGEWMVADDIASGRLVEALSEWTPSYPGYCLYYPERRHSRSSSRDIKNADRQRQMSPPVVIMTSGA